MGFIETSALDTSNIETAFETVLNNIYCASVALGPEGA